VTIKRAFFLWRGKARQGKAAQFALAKLVIILPYFISTVVGSSLTYAARTVLEVQMCFHT
jgi:hypothetical protein